MMGWIVAGFLFVVLIAAGVAFVRFMLGLWS